LIDALRSEGAQATPNKFQNLIVGYHSKVSFHFGNDFAIFFEREWRQHVNTNDGGIVARPHIAFLLLLTLTQMDGLVSHNTVILSLI
jgi:hypothetical protein